MRSVAEVARELDVSPERVRQLIESGALPAVRVGGRWVIENGVAARRPEGRPWNEAAAWGLLWLALDRPAPWLSVKQRQRARHRLAEGIKSHMERLAVRSESGWFRGHPSALRRLGHDVRLVHSGLSAIGAAGADLLVADHVEGYVRSVEVDTFVEQYGLEPARRGEGNVHLRVIHDTWPFDPDEVVAPRLVVALDLIEQLDERTSRAGRSLLNRALRELPR